MPITFDGDMNLQITLDGEFGNLQYYSDYFQYAGNTTVTPSLSEQVLHTDGLIMPSDVTVKPIPDTYGEVSQTGTTVTVNTSNEYPGTTRVVLNSDSFYDNSDATLNNSSLMVQGVVGYGVNGQRYVGSISERSASDIVVSGNEVTTPAGHYPTNVQTTIPAGQVSAPVATKGSVSNVHTMAVTPSVSYSEGYIDTGSQVGEAVIVSASELVSGSQTITENDTYDVTNLAEVVVEVAGHGELQTKSATYTPTTSQQTDTILPDEGYDGMDEVDITINAVQQGTAGTPSASKGTVSNHSVSVTPSVTNTTGYITGGTKTGTAVTVSASELVSGTLSISSGGTWYVANTEYVTVPDGTEGTPTATKGTVTSHSVTVMPSVTNSAGYISGGTHNGSVVTVTAAELVSGTKNILTPGTSDVTNYEYVSVPTGTAGTPVATKGSVSNHSVTVTPSVINSSGFIVGDTLTGSPVTVSASELVSGTKTITTNQSYVDVTNYATAYVDVPADDVLTVTISYYATSGTWLVNKTFAEWKSAYTDGKTIILWGQYPVPDQLCNWRYDSVDDVFYIYIAEYLSSSYVIFTTCTYGAGDVMTTLSREVDYYTADADAVSGNVVAGKKFYNDSGYQVGTLIDAVVTQDSITGVLTIS